jgi:hypothetical protein
MQFEVRLAIFYSRSAICFRHGARASFPFELARPGTAQQDF